MINKLKTKYQNIKFDYISVDLLETYEYGSEYQERILSDCIKVNSFEELILELQCIMNDKLVEPNPTNYYDYEVYKIKLCFKVLDEFDAYIEFDKETISELIDYSSTEAKLNKFRQWFKTIRNPYKWFNLAPNDLSKYQEALSDPQKKEIIDKVINETNDELLEFYEKVKKDYKDNISKIKSILENEYMDKME